MEQWKEYRLGDLLNFRRGHDLPKSEMIAGDIPVAGSNGVIGFHNEATPISPCITIGRSGNVGTPNFYEKCWAHNTVLYIDDFKENNPEFLFYLLKTIPLKSFGGGSAVPTLNRNHIHPIVVKSTKDIKLQQKIVDILKSLDDKIELNRQINDTLEQQAQALYLSYFSDTPLCCLGDMVKTASGGTPSRNNLDYYSHSGIDWVKSKELNRSIIFQTEERITNNAINYSSAKVLPKYSTLIAMYGATVGEYGLIAEPMTCNQAICALIPNENYPYTYLFMFAKNVRQELINNAVGSAQQNISQVMIKNMQISSDLDSIKKFDDSVRGIFDSYIHLSKEILYLTELRDTLLPRLMSGELKINEINC